MVSFIILLSIIVLILICYDACKTNAVASWFVRQRKSIVFCRAKGVTWYLITEL